MNFISIRIRLSIKRFWWSAYIAPASKQAYRDTGLITYELRTWAKKRDPRIGSMNIENACRQTRLRYILFYFLLCLMEIMEMGILCDI